MALKVVKVVKVVKELRDAISWFGGYPAMRSDRPSPPDAAAICSAPRLLRAELAPSAPRRKRVAHRELNVAQLAVVERAL